MADTKAATAATAHLASFRKGLKPGDATNCGLLVETKEALVQIQTQRDLRWMRRDQATPAGQACVL